MNADFEKRRAAAKKEVVAATEPPREKLSEDKILGETPLSDNDFYESPTINIKTTYDEMAVEVADAIPYGTLYWMDGKYWTIRENLTEGTLEKTEMSCARFVTWISQFCRFRSARKTLTSLSEAQAKIIMASDIFRDRCPQIAALSPIRLPILQIIDGKKHFAPAPLGYDPETKIYTLDTVPIDWEKTYPLDVCRRALITVFSEFALDGGLIGGTTDDRQAVSPVLSPSLGGCIAAMMGQFLHNIIDRYPLILINANKRGTGKTFLASVCLAPVWGEVPVSNYSSDENELKKMLNSFIFNGEPVCLLDDVKSLNNNTLNRYITTKRVRDRELATNNQFDKPMRMQFFATGNNLKSSEDIERRCIPIDLFFARDIRKRKFAYKVSESRLQDKKWRAEILMALWSILKHWEAAGFPVSIEGEALPSFHVYAGFVINPVIFAGFANPLGQRVVQLDSGDAMGHALREVITAVADKLMPAYGMPHAGTWRKYTIPELLEEAKLIDKLEIVTNYAPDERRAFGIAMRSIKGNEYVDSWGREFVVGSRKDSAGTAYRFEILSEPTREPEYNYPAD